MSLAFGVAFVGFPAMRWSLFHTGVFERHSAAWWPSFPHLKQVVECSAIACSVAGSLFLLGGDLFQTWPDRYWFLSWSISA